jgi:L-arabinonolactonase
MSTISQIGVWGESLCWDDLRQRLYFVDCATSTLHWLDHGEPPLHTFELPTMATGIGLTTSQQLVACLDDGLNIVDPDRGTTQLLAPYPEGMHGRANDMTVDPVGNLITGTLNAGPGPGSLWWFSPIDGWRHLDEDTGNTNGPVVTVVDGEPTLVVGDTVAAVVHAYAYDAEGGTVGPRRVLVDLGSIGGAPDGATVDADGQVWSCVLGTGTIACATRDVDAVRVPVRNPSDVTFGGVAMDRLYVTSIAVDLGNGPPSEESAHLLAVDRLGTGGVPEHRFTV